MVSNKSLSFSGRSNFHIPAPPPVPTNASTLQLPLFLPMLKTHLEMPYMSNVNVFALDSATAHLPHPKLPGQFTWRVEVPAPAHKHNLSLPRKPLEIPHVFFPTPKTPNHEYSGFSKSQNS